MRPSSAGRGWCRPFCWKRGDPVCGGRIGFVSSRVRITDWLRFVARPDNGLASFRRASGCWIGFVSSRVRITDWLRFVAGSDVGLASFGCASGCWIGFVSSPGRRTDWLRFVAGSDVGLASFRRRAGGRIGFVSSRIRMRDRVATAAHGRLRSGKRAQGAAVPHPEDRVRPRRRSPNPRSTPAARPAAGTARLAVPRGEFSWALRFGRTKIEGERREPPSPTHTPRIDAHGRGMGPDRRGGTEPHARLVRDSPHQVGRGGDPARGRAWIDPRPNGHLHHPERLPDPPDRPRLTTSPSAESAPGPWSWSRAGPCSAIFAWSGSWARAGWERSG